MSQLVLVLSAIGLPRCVLGTRKAVAAVIVHLDRRTSVTIRSGYARFEHGNGSFRSRPAEGVNSPVSFAAWILTRYIEVGNLPYSTRPNYWR